METKPKKDQSAANAINKATAEDVKKQEKELAEEAAQSNEIDPPADDPPAEDPPVEDPLADDPPADDPPADKNKPDPHEQSTARIKLEKD